MAHTLRLEKFGKNVVCYKYFGGGGLCGDENDKVWSYLRGAPLPQLLLETPAGMDNTGMVWKLFLERVHSIEFPDARYRRSQQIMVIIFAMWSTSFLASFVVHGIAFYVILCLCLASYVFIRNLVESQNDMLSEHFASLINVKKDCDPHFTSVGISLTLDKYLGNEERQTSGKVREIAHYFKLEVMSAADPTLSLSDVEEAKGGKEMSREHQRQECWTMKISNVMRVIY